MSILAIKKAALLKQVALIETLEKAVRINKLTIHKYSSVFIDDSGVMVSLDDNSQLKVSRQNVVSLRVQGMDTFINLSLFNLLSVEDRTTLTAEVIAIELESFFDQSLVLKEEIKRIKNHYLAIAARGKG